METLCLIFFLIVLLGHCQQASSVATNIQRHYYIKSTEISLEEFTCDRSPCLTLPEYAIELEYSSLHNSDVILTFLPGYHGSNTTLHIDNASSFTLHASGEFANINFTTFTFQNTDIVKFHNLGFMSSRNNFLNTKQVTFSKCLFHGNSTIILINATNATVTRCDFSGSRYTLESCNRRIHSLNKLKSTITCINSTIHSTNNLFTNLSAINGAVFNLNYSSLNIIENSFKSSKSCGQGGAVFAYQNSEVHIQDSSFQENFAKGIGGAISIIENSSLYMINTIYVGNAVNGSGGAVHADRNSSVVLDRNNTFLRNSAQNGGAMVILRSNVSTLDSNFTSNIAWSAGRVTCFETTIKYIGNYAKLRGAAILMEDSTVVLNGCTYFEENTAHYMWYLMKTSLICNGSVVAERNVGSIMFANSEATFNKHSHLYLDKNTPFLNKSAVTAKTHGYVPLQTFEGGALTLYESDVTFFGEIVAINNGAIYGGGIHAGKSKLNLLGTTIIRNNSASTSGGGIYIYDSALNFQDRANITKNRATGKGGGIHALSTTVTFNAGEFVFSKNEASNGGGVALEVNAKLHIIKNEADEFFGANLKFDDSTYKHKVEFQANTAEKGGAVYIRDESNYGACSAGESKIVSECSLQVIQQYTIKKHNYGTIYINFLFSNNTAKVSGDILYGGLLDRCGTSPYAEVNALSGILYLYTITNIYPLSNIKSGTSSEPVRICFCSNGHPNCSHVPNNHAVYKGQTVQLELVAVDQVNNISPNTIIFGRFKTLVENAALLHGSMQVTMETCTVLNFTVSSPRDQETLHLYAKGPCNDQGISLQELTINFEQCPKGFELSDTQSNCICHHSLVTFTNSCDINSETVHRKGNFWFSFHDHINSTKSGILVHPYCPYDYCNTQPQDINLNMPKGPDAQCAYNRSNKLCGECKKGYSITFGGSRCKKCSNVYIVLIIAFAVAGILLVVLILACNLTVAVGRLNGLIFYCNIITMNSSTFMPSNKLSIVTVAIAWTNLDLGIVTCFYDGMDAYVKNWLQFVFPMYLICIVVLIIIACNHSQYLSDFVGKGNPIAALATLILLSYTKLLRTCITALSFTYLEYPDGTKESVWLFDGNVAYLTGKHIPLFLAALVVIVLGFAYTAILTVAQWLLLFSNNSALKWMNNTKWRSFLDAYYAPYNSSSYYWVGLLLISRIVIYFVIAFNTSGDPGVNLISIACVTITLLVCKLMFKNIYKEHSTDFMESLFIINLTIFTLTTMYLHSSKDSNGQLIATYISATTAFAKGFGIILYHIYVYIAKRIRNAELVESHTESLQETGADRSHSVESTGIVTTTVIDLHNNSPP